MEKKTCCFILKYWFLSRLLIFLISIVVIYAFPFRPTYPYWQSDLRPLGPRYLWTWAGFDGAHYIRMAKEGYGSAFTQAFFPFYPLLIRFFNFLTGNSLKTGLLISNLSFIAFLFILYKLLASSSNKKTAKKTIMLYLFFPTSFFFNSVYTESLFILLMTLFFYFLQKNKWLVSAVLAGLSSALRLVGAFFCLAIFSKWVQRYGFKDKKTLLKGGLYSLISLLGLFCYMLFLKKEFNDPFAFLKAMSLWQKNKPVFFLQTFFRYLRMLFDFSLTIDKYFVVIFEFITATLFLYLLFISFKKVKLSYFIYNLFAFLLPISSGTFSSLPRYVLVLFPSFFILAKILAKNKKLNLLYWVFNFIFLVISVNLFVSGRFLA